MMENRTNLKENNNNTELKKTEINSEAEESGMRKLGTDMNYKFTPTDFSVYIFIFLVHVTALIGIYYCFKGAKIATVLWAALMAVIGIQTVVLGAHRAYSHNSFKPSKSLKIALILLQTTAGQNHVFGWASDHRVHHKFTDTDADPYNAARGFFFAHMQWYLVERHPLNLKKLEQIDVSDLLQDEWIMFQKKYFWELYFLIGFVFPIVIPVFCWNENVIIGICVAYSLRYIIILHSISSINSFAHLYGSKPFDKRINPCQSTLVHWVTGGDGWHNFHHCFPWDYGLSEFGYGKGLSTMAIEFFAKHGFATDLKKASINVVEGHSKRHGDGSNHLLIH